MPKEEINYTPSSRTSGFEKPGINFNDMETVLEVRAQKVSEVLRSLPGDYKVKIPEPAPLGAVDTIDAIIKNIWLDTKDLPHENQLKLELESVIRKLRQIKEGYSEKTFEKELRKFSRDPEGRRLEKDEEFARDMLKKFMNNFSLEFPGSPLREHEHSSRGIFHRDLDAVINKLKLPLEEVQCKNFDHAVLYKHLVRKNGKSSEQIKKDYEILLRREKILKTLFIEMRKLGYSHVDIAAG